MRSARIQVAIMLLLMTMIGCSDSPTKDSEADADASAERAKRESHPDYQALLGTWKIVSSDWDGSPNPRAVGNRMTFSNTRMEAWLKDLGNIYLDYEIDPTQSPKHLNAQYGFPPDRAIFRAIYEMGGDSLKICFRERERPTSFETERGSMWTSHVLERAVDQDP
jgi:uncharacterized protein (TIGR03067 family)